VVRFVLAAALVAFAFFGVPTLPKLRPEPATAVTEPSREMKNVVQPVVRIASTMNIVDRLWLQQIYLNTANVVEVDGDVGDPVVTTTEGLRAVHVAVLKFVWRGLAGNQPNKYDGLSKAIENAIESTIGGDNVPLTPESRSRAVEVFHAIAWAGLGKDG
jgi:hypothetical protein